MGGINLIGGMSADAPLLGVVALPFLPLGTARLAGTNPHGLVMVVSFMGTAISLERAIALRAKWAFGTPFLLGLDGIALLGGWAPLGHLFQFEGALLLFATYVALWQRSPITLLAVFGLSAVMLVLATALAPFLTIKPLVPMLCTFLVATIAAERAELAQLTLPKTSEKVIATLVVALALAAALYLVLSVTASVFGALALAALALWLAANDVAKTSIRRPGIHRFIGAALLIGYFWLLIAAGTWLVTALCAARVPPLEVAAQINVYDVVIHSVFVGFGLSMIMAHAPVILPAVIHRSLSVHRLAWAPLLVMNIALAVRVGGDFVGLIALWQVGAVLIIFAVLAFLVSSIYFCVKGKR